MLFQTFRFLVLWSTRMLQNKSKDCPETGRETNGRYSSRKTSIKDLKLPARPKRIYKKTFRAKKWPNFRIPCQLILLAVFSFQHGFNVYEVVQTEAGYASLEGCWWVKSSNGPAVVMCLFTPLLSFYFTKKKMNICIENVKQALEKEAVWTFNRPFCFPSVGHWCTF